MPEPVVYSYSFVVMPDPNSTFTQSLWEFMKSSAVRVVMEFSEEGFAEFRFDLKRDGFVLHEIERWPYFAPEAITNYI